MSVTTTKLPPSGRDFGVYTAVRVLERTTREVAAEFGISQTRVCQIVERVALFMLDAAPEGMDADHAKRVQLAEQVAAMRLQHLYGTAVRDYEASKGKPVIRETEAEGSPKKTITTTKVGVGEVKLLDRAVKFALAGAKLPVATLAQHVVWEEEGDCSSVEVEQPVTSLGEVPEMDATADAGGDCVRAMLEILERNDSAARPVQTALQPADRRLHGRKKAARKAFLAAAG